MKKSLLNFALPIAIGAIGGAIILITAGAGANARAVALIDRLEASPTVQRLHDQSTVDYVKVQEGSLTESELHTREKARLQTIHELYKTGGLRGSPDYMISAELLERSDDADNVLLAHDLAVLATSLNAPDALRLSARTEEKFLKLKGWGPRFGQVHSAGESKPSDVASWHRKAVGMEATSVRPSKSGDVITTS